MKLKKSNIKKKQIIIMVAFIILLGVGATLAWWRWSSQINALIYGDVCVPEIVFVGGTTINGSDMLPVLTKEEGLTKDINVNLNNTCANDTAVLNLNLVLEYFPVGLADASVKWGLYEVTTEEVQGEPTETLTFVNSGNFANKVQNNTIPLASNLVVTSNISTYRLFIWIDATMENPSTIGDNNFRFKLYGDGYGAIYNEYTMKQATNTASTASFWGSEINANQVKSIRFIPSDQVPSNYTGTYDISSVADTGDIMMYYVENGQTEDETPITLYDVYVASNNGMTKAKANVSAEKMFAYLSNCEYIDAENLDTSDTTNMSNMFLNTSKLSTLKISNWDTSKVTTMASMFNNCGTSELTFNISTFDTSKVTTMEGMFSNSNASSINLSNFTNESLNIMKTMFRDCKASTITFKNFNTSNVTDMQSLFTRCTKVVSLDLSSFNTSKVTVMCGNGYTWGMFEGCSSLEYLDISSFDTSKVSRMDFMFSSCSKLKNLNVSGFDTEGVWTMAGMFSNCSALTSLDLSNFNTSDVTYMGSMFNGLKLSELDVSNFDTSKVTTMASMFGGCSNITSLDLSNFNTANVTSMASMFSGCSKLETLDVSNFNTRKVTNMSSMFFNCSKLKVVDLSSFETPLLTNMTTMFRCDGASSYVLIDMRNFDFSGVSNYGNAFYHATREVIVKNCTQYNLFKTKFGTWSSLHTVNNDNCSA